MVDEGNVLAVGVNIVLSSQSQDDWQSSASVQAL